MDQTDGGPGLFRLRSPHGVPAALAAIGVGAAVTVAAALGTLPLLGVMTVLLLGAFVELRRVLGPPTGVASLVVGAAGVVAFFVAGVELGAEALPGVLAGLVIALFVVRILAVELAHGAIDGATSDVAATTTAAAVTGLLGAHALLVRATPRFGTSGAVTFGLMVGAGLLAATIADHFGRRKLPGDLALRRTWEGLVAGCVASAAAGAGAGLAWNPPFRPASGALFGAVVGLLAPLGEVAVAGLARSASVAEPAGSRTLVAGLLELSAGWLFSAPFFYWVFRTLVL